MIEGNYLLWRGVFLMMILFLNSCTEKSIVFIHENPDVQLVIESNGYNLTFTDGLIDSEHALLEYEINEKHYSFDIWFGTAISSLQEKEPIIFQEREVYNRHLKNEDLNVPFYYVSPKVSIDKDLYLKQSVKIDSIAGSLVKIITPRRGREGLYAVHFYCIPNTADINCWRMTIMGCNLDSVEEIELMRLAKSVSFD